MGCLKKLIVFLGFCLLLVVFGKPIFSIIEHLAYGIGILLVIIVFVFIIGVMFFGGSSSGNDYAECDRDRKERKKITQQKFVNNNQQIIDNWSAPFWRDKGGYGIGVPQADCIYCYDYTKNKKFLCTVKDFENGSVAIIDQNTKKRVMNIAGCNIPIK